MIPRIGRQGSSFKGAAAYYLHDKKAETAQRIAFTDTRNLPTQDAQLAWRVMAVTAMNADDLKRESGIKLTGRRSEKPVFHFSLSWHPEEQPDRRHMTAAMDSALAALGLQDRQAVYVSHNDEPHPHIHAIVNLVHPETGRSSTVKFSKETLSRWAEAYEQEHGVYCEERIENNARRASATRGRKQGLKPDFPRHKERALELRSELTALYQAADSGRAFRAALQERGYELAYGRRILLVDRDGKIHGLARQLEGVKAAELRAKLSDIELPNVDDARAHVMAAAKNRMQDAQLDNWGKFYDQSARDRQHLDETFEQHYGAREKTLMNEIRALEAKRWPSRADKKELEALRLSLANIEQRKSEQRTALENRIEENRRELAQTQARQRAAQPTDPPRPAERTYEQQRREYLQQLKPATHHARSRGEPVREAQSVDDVPELAPAISPAPLDQQPGVDPPTLSAPAAAQTYEEREAAYLQQLAGDLGAQSAPEQNPAPQPDQ